MVDAEEEAKELENIRAFLANVAVQGEQGLTDRPGNFRGMFYGNDGTGKTIAGLALLNHIVPADKRIILVDTSENGLSIRNHPGLNQKLPDGSPRITRLRYGGERWLHALAATIRRGQGGFENVGGIQFDEFATMADTMLGIILKVVEAANPTRPKDDATWPEYKMLLRKMKNIIQTFGSLEGVHCVFVAHFRTDKDGRGLPVEAPNFTPSVGPEIRKPMHLIANLTVNEEGQREFQIQPDRGHLAKCKIGGLGRTVLFPELANATKKWLNGEIATEEKTEVVERIVNVTDEETMTDEGYDL
jgi:hypothetical protein